MIVGYFVGLNYGPKGVAFCYSAVLMLWAIPLVLWAVRGTMISARDIFLTVSRPLISGIVAAGIVFALQFLYGPSMSPLVRLIVGTVLLSGIYVVMLLHVMGQKEFYLNVIKGFRSGAPVEEQISVPV